MKPKPVITTPDSHRPANLSTGDRLPAVENLFIDARMLFSSGIGRYLREVITRWPKTNTPREVYFCNSAKQVEWLSRVRPDGIIRRTAAGIYSWREQLLAINLPANSVYWVPHYNLPWLCRARLIATVHDAAPLVLHSVFHRLVQRLAARFYFGAARRTTHRVIAVSVFTARELMSHAKIPGKKIDVVLNGVAEEWFTASAISPRPAHRLLFVGNLKPHKNLFRLVEAIELLRAQGHHYLTLDIVGKIDGFRAGLEFDQTTRLRKLSWVKLHLSLDDEKLRSLYTEVGALVFPSLYEGFGLPLLEAMAGGCPVLASSEASLPEIAGPDMQDGGGVLYFNAYDVYDIAKKIGFFCQLSDEKRMAMSQSGHARARSFSWNEAAQETRNILLA